MKALFIDGPAAGRVVETSPGVIRTMRIDTRIAQLIPAVADASDTALSPTFQVDEYYSLSHKDLPFGFTLWSCGSFNALQDKEARWNAAMMLLQAVVMDEYHRRESDLLSRMATLESSMDRLGKSLTNLINNHRLSDKPADD